MKFTALLVAMVAMTEASHHHHRHGRHHVSEGRHHHYTQRDAEENINGMHMHQSKHGHRMFPEKLGDKNTETKESTWSEYEKNRPQLQDCSLNEKYNWFGNHRCKEEWECQGARVCEYMSYGHDGVQGIGWCRGPTACQFKGPLDKEDKDGKIKYNPGSNQRRDMDEWDH